MATILRSSKYFRYFASIGRNLVFNSSRGEIQDTVIPQKQCLNFEFPKFLVTHAVASHTSNDSNLERNLKRLDQNVRRTGRISKRDLEDILDELRHSGSATSTQSLHIIRCCGNLIPEESPEIRTRLIQEIWKTLDNIGVPMDISHYNALLRVYLENEHSFSPTEFLANLEHKGLEPNRVTYQRLIARYCQDGDIEGATRILEFMREKQLPVNENVFNALIMGHSQADDMESAVGILGVMQQAGLEPSAETYTALLCGYAKKGDIEAINSTLQECEKKDIDFLHKDYMNIIFALAVNNNLQHVDKIIERMKQGAGYNQDAVNLILRLVNIGHEDLAYKIFLTMPYSTPEDNEQSSRNMGRFFIHQLVKANRPLEKIKAICEKLENEDLNPIALQIATEISLKSGNIEQAYGLLEAMRDRNLPIRQHYFWPLLAKYSRQIDSMLGILSHMSSEFKLTIGGETLRDYVIPSLEKKSADEIISLLKSTGVSIAAAASAIVIHHLNQNNIALAAQVATRYHSHYSPTLLRKPLVQAYVNTEDANSFISILRRIHDSVDTPLSTDDDFIPVSVPDHAEMVGQFVIDVAAASQKNRIKRIEAILQGLLDQGLCLSNSAAERLQEILGETLTDEVSNLLGKLTSGELVPVKLSRQPTPAALKLDEVQMLKIQKSLEEKGESTQAIKKQLLLLYCRNRELEKAEQLIKELEENSFPYSAIMYGHILDLYLHFENIDEINKILSNLEEKQPDFLLDSSKIIRFAALLVKNDKVSDAVELLSKYTKEQRLEDRTFNFSALCFRLLNSMAEKGNVNEVKEMFSALVKNEYVDINNVILGPLVKVHLVRNDLAGALDEFEYCCQNYRTTPWKNELTRRFIQAEDPTSLQRLTDLSIQIHGEVNSLYDLMFAFVECGRIRQATKILETPGLRNRPHRLSSACERYQQEGLVEPLEGLMEATRDISHIDRLDIYYHLLLSYCKSGDPDKALGLWTRMQEENVQPSDEFLATLGHFLTEKGRDVPFVIPEVELPPELSSFSLDSQENVSSTSRKLREALQQNKLDLGLEIKQKAADELSVTDLSLLIERLVKAERYGEVLKLVQEMLAKDLYPLPRIMRFYLNRLAAAGDVDTISVIGNQLPENIKKVVSYDNRFCHATVNAGKASEYLKKLSQEIENADESNKEEIVEKFPRGGVLGILQKHPELHSEYEEMALKCAEKGIIEPINVLWMYYFASGKEDAAEVIWNKYLVGSPRVMYQHILRHAYKTFDEIIPQRLIKTLKDSCVSERARGNVYSCSIDVLVHKEKIDEALTVLKDAVEDVCLENINRSALTRLKNRLVKQGKTFPYQIPAKIAKDSGSSGTSSSSSDDEPTRKKSQ